jgi:hypothetical protein
MNHQPSFYSVSGAILILFSALIFIGCATTEPPPPATAKHSELYIEGSPGKIIANTIEINARVASINTEARELTLLKADGEMETIKVGPGAVNFDQIKVDDVVKVTLTEQVLIRLLKEGESAPDEAVGIVAGAAKGEQPAGIVAKVKRITGMVTAINTEARTVTLGFENGSSKNFLVRDDIDLSRHSVGEKVMFIIADSIAIEVEKE